MTVVSVFKLGQNTFLGARLFVKDNDKLKTLQVNCSIYHKLDLRFFYYIILILLGFQNNSL